MAVILAIDDRERTHLATQANPNQHGKQVKVPDRMRPEEHEDGEPLEKETQGHSRFAPRPVGENRDREAREGTHPIHGAEHQSASGEREPLAPNNIREIDDNNGVAGAPPVVDANEVPEGRRPRGVLEKHFRAYARVGAAMDSLDRRAWGHAEGIEPLFRRLIREKADEHQEEDASDDARSPEGPAPTPIGQQDDHQGGKEDIRKALGGL